MSQGSNPGINPTFTAGTIPGLNVGMVPGINPAMTSHMQSLKASVDENMRTMNDEFAKLKTEFDHDREERLRMKQNQMRR